MSTSINTAIHPRPFDSSSHAAAPLRSLLDGPDQRKEGAEQAAEVRDAFTSFVGQTFFSQMIKAMRTSVGKPAYFHGGQAEEIFRGQLDQVLSEEMTAQSDSKLTGPMFKLQFPELARQLDELENLPRR